MPQSIRMRVPCEVPFFAPFLAAVSKRKLAPVTVPTPVQNVILGVDEVEVEVEDIFGRCAI